MHLAEGASVLTVSYCLKSRLHLHAAWACVLYICLVSASRYLLRLGMGEQELATTDDFSRVGRVNAMLARRLELLAEV